MLTAKRLVHRRRRVGRIFTIQSAARQLTFGIHAHAAVGPMIRQLDNIRCLCSSTGVWHWLLLPVPHPLTSSVM